MEDTVEKHAVTRRAAELAERILRETPEERVRDLDHLLLPRSCAPFLALSFREQQARIQDLVTRNANFWVQLLGRACLAWAIIGTSVAMASWVPFDGWRPADHLHAEARWIATNEAQSAAVTLIRCACIAFCLGGLLLFQRERPHLHKRLLNDVWQSRFSSGRDEVELRLWMLCAQIELHALYSPNSRQSHSIQGSTYHPMQLRAYATQLRVLEASVATLFCSYARWQSQPELYEPLEEEPKAQHAAVARAIEELGATAVSFRDSLPLAFAAENDNDTHAGPMAREG